jgi:hypothetical protein
MSQPKGRNKVKTLVSLIAACTLVSLPALAQEAAWLDGVQKLELTRVVQAGKKARLYFSYAVLPDCSNATGETTVKVTTEPEHGTIEVVAGEGFPSFPPENIRAKCNTKRIQGKIVSYKSANGYTGADKFEMSVFLPGGFVREVTYNLNKGNEAK